MRQLSIPEFQSLYKYYFNILIDFFEKYNIPYSLAYGTLLGAYRNNDMIEWDSDIDLFITKESEELIRKNLSNLPDCFRFDNYADGNTFFMLNRVIIKNLFRKKGDSKRECWIDLFVVGAMDNKKENFAIWKKINKQLKISDLKYRTNGKNFFKTFIRNFIGLFLPKRKKTNLICEKLHKKITNLNHECFSGLYGICGVDFCDEYINLLFGDRYYKCFKNTKEILTHLYGDNFMTPKKYNVSVELFYLLEDLK